MATLDVEEKEEQRIEDERRRIAVQKRLKAFEEAEQKTQDVEQFIVRKKNEFNQQHPLPSLNKRFTSMVENRQPSAELDLPPME